MIYILLFLKTRIKTGFVSWFMRKWIWCISEILGKKKKKRNRMCIYIELGVYAKRSRFNWIYRLAVVVVVDNNFWQLGSCRVEAGNDVWWWWNLCRRRILFLFFLCEFFWWFGKFHVAAGWEFKNFFLKSKIPGNLFLLNKFFPKYSVGDRPDVSTYNTEGWKR